MSLAMDMVKCEKCGRFYNRAVNSECTFCAGTPKTAGVTTAVDYQEAAAPAFESMKTTTPVNGANVNAAVTNSHGGNATVPVNKLLHEKAVEMADSDDGSKTAPAPYIDPVVGWLVAINGTERGRDYRIHTDNNFLGSGDNMDICIKGDASISRENHVRLVYDGRERTFYVAPGDGRNIVRLNGKALLMTAELNARDVLEVGITKLMFIPLCGKDFNWKEVEAEFESEE